MSSRQRGKIVTVPEANFQTLHIAKFIQCLLCAGTTPSTSHVNALDLPDCGGLTLLLSALSGVETEAQKAYAALPEVRVGSRQPVSGPRPF